MVMLVVFPSRKVEGGGVKEFTSSARHNTNSNAVSNLSMKNLPAEVVEWQGIFCGYFSIDSVNIERAEPFLDRALCS
jgi:hypothetical protein